MNIFVLYILAHVAQHAIVQPTFKIIKQQHDCELMIFFLKGLSDNCNTIRSQILLMDPLLSVNKVLSLVLQQKSSPANTLVQESKIFYDTSNKNNCNHGCGRSPYVGRGLPKQCIFFFTTRSYNWNMLFKAHISS